MTDDEAEGGADSETGYGTINTIVYLNGVAYYDETKPMTQAEMDDAIRKELAAAGWNVTDLGEWELRQIRRAS